MLLIFYLILIINFFFNELNAKDHKIHEHHVSVSISEQMLNNFLVSIGEVSGKGSKDILGKELRYFWKVSEPKISIHTEKVIFSADLNIKSGKISSTSKTESELSVEYSVDENLIKIYSKDISTDLKINLFGKPIKLATIDLSNYYRPSFEFKGPEINQKSFVIDKPDGSKVSLNLDIQNQALLLNEGKITVFSNVIFNKI